MKKIGILTFHRSYNYGAFMQCYSFSRQLEKDFPSCKVEVIDYTPFVVFSGYRNIEDKNEILSARNRAFQEFQETHLPLSDEKIITDDYNELFDKIKGKYDVIIVGSDAVWNWITRGFPNAYFLGSELDAKKMSYAASSHGMDFQKITEEQKSLLKGYFNDFEYIGVREKTTTNMVKMVDENLKPYDNCDPTVFLELENLPVDIEKLKEKLQNKGVDFSKPIIGIMAGSVYGRQIKRYFGNKIQLVAIYEPNKYADFYLNDLTPFEWAKIFSLFQATITHFFHGTMLSLENLTPVIAIEISSTYNETHTTKIKNALTNMGLLEFYEIWERKKDLYNRVLYKLNFKNDMKFWGKVCHKIEILIKEPPKVQIKKALEKEKEKYNSFRDTLKNILEDK